MRHRSLTALVALSLVLSLELVLPTSAGAQDVPATAVPTQDIVPAPNTGHAPTEAGDRGGALQLLLPALILVAVGGAVLHLTRQSRRARAEVE